MRKKLELEAEKATPPTPENIVLLREILAELKKEIILLFEKGRPSLPFALEVPVGSCRQSCIELTVTRRR